jgi:hypothetical protein
VNITESCDLNNLLEYLLNVEGCGTHVQESQALDCARRLAERANRALMAGFSGADLERLWLAAAPRPSACKRRPTR